MMRLEWVRTVLVALGFVWAMLAWQVHERGVDRERSYVRDLIVRLCATDYPDSPADRDQCEIDYRTRLLNGLSVNGTLTVSSAAEDDAPAGAEHARVRGARW